MQGWATGETGHSWTWDQNWYGTTYMTVLTNTVTSGDTFDLLYSCPHSGGSIQVTWQYYMNSPDSWQCVDNTNGRRLSHGLCAHGP